MTFSYHSKWTVGALSDQNVVRIAFSPPKRTTPHTQNSVFRPLKRFCASPHPNNREAPRNGGLFCVLQALLVVCVFFEEVRLPFAGDYGCAVQGDVTIGVGDSGFLYAEQAAIHITL